MTAQRSDEPQSVAQVEPDQVSERFVLHLRVSHELREFDTGATFEVARLRLVRVAEDDEATNHSWATGDPDSISPPELRPRCNRDQGPRVPLSSRYLDF